MEKVKKQVYNIDYNFLSEMEEEDGDAKKVYNIINKDLIEQEKLKKIEEIKRSASGMEDFKFEALKDIINNDEAN